MCEGIIKDNLKKLSECLAMRPQRQCVKGRRSSLPCRARQIAWSLKIDRLKQNHHFGLWCPALKRVTELKYIGSFK